MGETEPPAAIRPVLQDLEVLYRDQSHNHDQITATIKALAQSLKEYPALYESYLGDMKFGFAFVTQNILNTYTAIAAQGIEFKQIRDRLMFENFSTLYNQLPPGRYFGQWGLNHIFQASQLGIDWVAALMNRPDFPLSDKILSLAYIYMDCQQIITPDYHVRTLNFHQLEDLLELAPDPYTLFRLTGPDSPFTEQLIWLFPTTAPEAGVTTDYFQYYLLIKDAPPASPLDASSPQN